MSAIMNTVYNNYLTTYASRQITKYDTHKKSELRSVYNSIVKLSGLGAEEYSGPVPHTLQKRD